MNLATSEFQPATYVKHRVLGNHLALQISLRIETYIFKPAQTTRLLQNTFCSCRLSGFGHGVPFVVL